KTALVADAELTDRYYVYANNPHAWLLAARAGLAGLLTSRINVVAKVGWAADLGQSTANTFIGIGEVTYLVSAISTLKAGVARMLLPVSTYGTYADLRAYVEARMLIGGRMQLHGLVAYDLLDYYSPKAGTTTSEPTGRKDNLVSVDVGPQ